MEALIKDTLLYGFIGSTGANIAVFAFNLGRYYGWW